MNVIFLDFDGVLYGISDYNDEEKKVEKRVAILADICKEYNCKVVIEASSKGAIDETTLEISPNATSVKRLFNLFKKYGIEVIGRTPTVEIKTGPDSSISMWKEDEIRLYLLNHPEIEHYCIIDDDDTRTTLRWEKSDLEKLKDHLVRPLYYSDNPDKEGLQPEHKKLVGEILKKENELRPLAIKRSHSNRTQAIFDIRMKLDYEAYDLEKARKGIEKRINELSDTCHHEMVFKYMDNHSRKAMIDGHYYCPACRKNITIINQKDIDNTPFKDSRVISLTHLSLIGDSDTLETISSLVSENIDLFYYLLSDEEIKERVSAILKDKQTIFENGKVLKKNIRRDFYE